MSPIENAISEAQLNANRANAQRSTGPVTPEGKKRSSINATRHGLTGQFHAFSEEDQRAFDAHCTALIADFNPQSVHENVLAVAIAEDHWRLNRARALENNIFAVNLSGDLGESTDGGDRPEVHTAATQARTWSKEAHNIQLLTLYETRIRRNIDKNWKLLTQLQAERQQRLEADLRNARLLAELAALHGETYDPAPDFPQYATPPQGPALPIHKRVFTAQFGFEFSASEFTRRQDLDQRLAEARRLAENGWRRPATTERSLTHAPKAA